MNLYLNSWRKMFKPYGRASRAEMLWSVLFDGLVALAICAFSGLLVAIAGVNVFTVILILLLGLFSGVVGIAMLIKNFSLKVRRIHDCNWQPIMMLIPFISLALCFMESFPKKTKWGPPANKCN